MDQFDDALVMKDRIAFEYVRVPEDTPKFDFKLLQVIKSEESEERDSSMPLFLIGILDRKEIGIE